MSDRTRIGMLAALVLLSVVLWRGAVRQYRAEVDRHQRVLVLFGTTEMALHATRAELHALRDSLRGVR